MYQQDLCDAMYLGKAKTASNIAWHRPMSNTFREEEELIQKSFRELVTTTDPLDRLRLLCLSRGAAGIMAIGRIFRRMADNGHKQLNKEEFINGIKEAGLHLSDEDADKLFKTFDKEDTGYLSLDEFLKQIRPPMSDSRRAIVEQAFSKLDKDGHGVISIDDIRKRYAVTSHPRYMSGEETSEVIMDRFVAGFETEGSNDGKVTLEEFINYYSGLSIGIEQDSYFDLMIRQAYKL